MLLTKDYLGEITALVWRRGRLFLFVVINRDENRNDIGDKHEKLKKLLVCNIHCCHLLPESSGRKQKKFFTFLPKKVNNPFVRSTETIPYYGKAAV